MKMMPTTEHEDGTQVLTHVSANMLTAAQLSSVPLCEKMCSGSVRTQEMCSGSVRDNKVLFTI